MSQDKYAEVYHALTPYQYAANNPVKVIDEAGKLLKDEKGNIIATSTGKFVNRYETTSAADGKTYLFKTTYHVVTVYTDKGVGVNALLEVCSEVSRYDGNGVYTPVSGDANPIGTNSNCYGYALAGGKLVIEDVTQGFVRAQSNPERRWVDIRRRIGHSGNGCRSDRQNVYWRYLCERPIH